MAVAKRGFSKGAINSPTQATTKSVIDDLSKQTVRNLFSVCSHIQDPLLYQPKWADACTETTSDDGRVAVVATKDVKKGQPLTLFPIHALGLRWLNRKNSGTKSKRDNNKSTNQSDDVEFVAYDADRDPNFMSTQAEAGLRIRLNIPLDKDQPAYQPILGARGDRVLFSMLDTSKQAISGWIGGKIHSSQSSTGMKSNCFTLPLPGCAPLCGIVATRDIKSGEELIKTIFSPSSEDISYCKDVLRTEFEQELSELKQYIEMACKPMPTEVSQTHTDEVESFDIGPFHAINEQYPGLRKLHTNPDIYAVDGFLSEDECDRLIKKASLHLRPCLVKKSSGVVEPDPSRTNSDANIPQNEIPSIVEKLTNLLSSDADHLEIMQVLNYKGGQKFDCHSDGFHSPVSACGFENANRVATVFTYLNDVECGGETAFPELCLKIKPKKGMAVLHFPSDLELREDERTIHEGSTAIDEKWLLATWLWSETRSDKNYFEESLPSLSSDII
eukprot:scaffold1717_cov62-Cyclotella_meneghiniana.AAC.9